MNRIASKKLDAFARAHKLRPEQRARLATALSGASAAQAGVILSQASLALLSHSVRVRPVESEILGPNGRPLPASQQPAHVK